MGDNDLRDMLFGIQRLHELHHLDAGLRVEGTSGLIGQDDLRLGDERPGDGHALFLSAAELIGIVSGPVEQAEPFQIFQSELMALAATDTLIEEGQLDVLHSRLEADEVEALEDEAYHAVAIVGSTALAQVLDEHASQLVGALVIVVEDAQDVEQRGLARARCSHDADELTRTDVEVDAFQHMQGLRSLISLVDVL